MIKNHKSLLSITALLLFGTFQNTSYSPLAPYIMQELGINVAQIGFMSSLFFWSTIIAIVAAGLTYQKCCLRKTLLVVASMYFLGILIVLLFPTITSYILLRIIVGSNHAFIFLGCINYISKQYKNNKGMAIGIFIGLGNSGGILSILVSNVVLDKMGIQGFFITSIIIMSTILLYCIVNLPKHREMSGQLKIELSVLKNIENWNVGISMGVITLPTYILGSLWGVTLYEKMLSLSNTNANIIMTFFWLGLIAGGFILGRIADSKYKPKNPLFKCMIFQIATLFSIIMLPKGAFFMAVILSFTSGALTCCKVFGYARISKINNEGSSNMATTFIMILLNIIGGFGQVACSSIINYSSSFTYALITMLTMHTVSAAIINPVYTKSTV